MTTENLDTENTIVKQVPEYTEIEQRALEMGWRPKTDFEGDDADFVDAKEFVARKPLYDKISEQSKKLKNVQRSIEALKTHYDSVRESEYNRAMKDLKAQRKQALVEGDADAFESADDQIKEAEEQYAKLKQEQVQVDEPEPSPIFVSWKSRNPWYDSVDYMRAYADKLGQRLHARGVSPDEILVEVEKAVKTEFPNKFKNPNKENAPGVSTGKNQGSASKGAEYQLTDQEFQVWKTLNKMDPERFTKEKYIADLKKVKGA